MSGGVADVVVCGAGIAGIAAAHELAVRRGLRRVVLVERGDPLALTSDKSTEAYRNWWPGPDDAMVRLMNRSIDMLEEIARATDNRILLNRRGYLYATADEPGLAEFQAQAEAISALGAGELRVFGRHKAHGMQNAQCKMHNSGPASHAQTQDMAALPLVQTQYFASLPAPGPYLPAPAHGFEGQPGGADLILDQGLIRAHFPYLAERTLAVLHVRRAGWFSAWQLGMHLLEQARAHGAELLRGELTGVRLEGGRVAGVEVATAAGTRRIATPALVSAAGPLQQAVASMIGLELPLANELHLKAAINDVRGAIPRHAPMLIWNDPVALPWSDEERAELLGDPELAWLARPLPAGAHLRPEGGGASTALLLLWDYHTGQVAPTYPIALDEQLPELALRGLATMVPGLAPYVERVPQAFLDGGYYTRTRENRPLIGPLPVGGAFICGGLSGFGLMAACAAGELLAAHVTGAALPGYAPAFDIARYDDPAYLAALDRWGGDGQL